MGQLTLKLDWVVAQIHVEPLHLDATFEYVKAQVIFIAVTLT